jgi:ADP-ribose pyrophosphatase
LIEGSGTAKGRRMDEATSRARYDELRRSRPELFLNPPGAGTEILLDPADVAAAEAEVARRLRANGQPEEWALTGVVYEDQYLLIVRDAVRFRTGTLGTYIREFDPLPAPGVVILPVMGDKVILVRHFRHGDRRWHVELPRGYGTHGRDPQDDVRHELAEEIGATPTRIVPVGAMNPDAASLGDHVLLYYVEIDGFGEPDPEEGISEIIPADPVEVGRMIASGEITDGFTICAFARALLCGLLPGSTLAS